MAIKQLFKKYKSEVIGGISGIIIWLIHNYKVSQGTAHTNFWFLNRWLFSLGYYQQLLVLFIGGIIAGFMIKNLYRRFK